MSLLNKIFIKCEDCSHSAELDLAAARRKFNLDLTHEIIPTLFNALKCSRCGAHKPRILDEFRLPLYHRTPRPKSTPRPKRTPRHYKKPPPPDPAREILHCIACGRRIDAFHLADMPGALFCASCEPGSKPGAHASPYPQPPPRLSTYPKCIWTTPLPGYHY